MSNQHPIQPCGFRAIDHLLGHRANAVYVKLGAPTEVLNSIGLSKFQDLEHCQIVTNHNHTYYAKRNIRLHSATMCCLKHQHIAIYRKVL